ncbi:MAG TPA: GNAT family N-acetyltransferase [Anaeromyxobacteraceae bacterium]|nr:GNAT family N-acetyltransferase [Anaeromyxobacteraceae bacterium]
MLRPDDPASLAPRIERAQAWQMIRTARAHPAGGSWIDAGGGWSVSFGPRSPFNAAVGVGLAGSVDPGALLQIEEHLGAGGGAVRIEVASPADHSLAGALAHREYGVERFHQVWWRPPSPLPAAADAGTRPIRPGEEDLWLDIFGATFLGGAPTGPLREGLRAMPRAEGNVCFLAFADGAPAGVAMASCEAGVALLTGAGVLERFRGRGLQASMVRARLEWAAARGCDLAASATDPGTASQRTLEKAGFRSAYPKAVMVRPAP